MSTDFTFAYGSNMNSSDLRSWLERNGFDSSRVVNRWPAKLDGYDFVWNYYSAGRAGGAANLEPREGSTIEGVLIEFESVLLSAFDRKEGHPYFYSRGTKRIQVRRMSDGQTQDAWLYVAKANKADRRDVWPTREYKKIVLEGAKSAGLSEEFVERIRVWRTSD